MFAFCGGCGRAMNRTLVAIGGNELKSIDSDIFKEMIRLGGRSSARVAVIPTASAIPKERGRVYTELFSEFHPRSVDVLMVGSRSDATDPAILRVVEEATIVMFSGGDQLRLSAILGGTALDALLRRRYESGCIIAGSSAGAAALPQIMIFQNNRFRAYRKGGLEITQGMGFIRDILLDTHFVQRHRISRLVHAVSTNPGILGLGIEENTALIIESERVARCLGTGTVIVVDGREVDHNLISEVSNGQPFAITGIRYSVLTAGLGLDLTTRKAFILDGPAMHVVEDRSRAASEE